MGSAKWQELLATSGSARQAIDTRTDAPARLDAARLALAQLDAQRGRLLVLGASDYPATLRDLALAPPVLFASGDPTAADRTCVAIVGTRNATPYGIRVAREMAGAVVRAGGCVVSGMARGIDAAAHRGALDAGGATIAVLGTGVDVPYPSAHRGLHAEIVRHGCVLSEHGPGVRATPGSFPERNRIIAALSKVVLVVEAPHKSGALITAAIAASDELDRSVMAVPGPIDCASSAGCNRLIRDGAQVATDIADLLQLAGLTIPVRPSRASGLPADQRAVWDALAAGALDADSLAARSKLPARTCLAAVTRLELAGLIECELTGAIRRRGM